ncbi:MAG: NAD(P)/FAD-dependent oxidoreductase, partial [Nitrospinales bacterium]
ALSPMRLSGVYISAYETDEWWAEYPPMEGRPGRVESLSLPRKALDCRILEEVRKAGVDVREQHKVHDLIFQGGTVAGVKGWDADKTAFSFRAKVVVDAGGRNCVSIRRLNLRVLPKRSGKMAVSAHWEGVRLPRNYCYMHVSPPGYTGIAPVSGDRANVVLVVDSRRLKDQEVEDFYVKTVLQNRQRGALLDGGNLTEKPRTVDSLAYSVKNLPCGGLLLVGDAMGFIDPFTGEGIYLSLRSAQMAAATIDSAFGKSDFSRRCLSEYEKARMAEFHKKFLLSKILQKLIYNPSLCRGVVRTLAANPSLGKLLVGAIGDYWPAESVVSLKYLARLISGAILPELKNPQENPRPTTQGTSNSNIAYRERH